MSTTEPGGGAPARRWPWIVAVVASALVGGVVGGVIVSQTGLNSNSSSGGASCNVSSVAHDVLPSVVTLSVNQGQGGTGSGEIIRRGTYILTNDHVIASGAAGGAIAATFNDGRSEPATIVGRDPLTDLAVLRVSEGENQPTIAIGSSSTLTVGQSVVALGAPLGLSSSVTSGIVSALGRTIQVPGQNGARALLPDAVQTDAAINPGNSGGALVDCSGALVGVPTAGATAPSPSGQSSAGSIGIGFAIPVNLATLVSNEIIDTGSVSHAYIGLQLAPVPGASGAAGAAGLLINQVDPAGPAAAAGLRPGDIITRIDGEPATSADQLVAVTLTKRAGERVSITYKRNGRVADTQVTLASQW